MTNISLTLKLLSEEHDRFHDQAVDWLIASWQKRGDEKKICLLKYKIYTEKAMTVNKKIIKFLKDVK